MCVIFVVDQGIPRPSELMVEKAYHSNNDGAGIGWQEPAEDGIGIEQVWKKDLNLDEIQELVATVPQPFIAHFRVASIGGVRPELTHPFEIGPEATNFVEFRTKNPILFHNGHWDRWQDFVLSSAPKFGVKIPRYKWNDSRALAFLGWLYSDGIYEFLPSQRIAILGPDGPETFGDNWKIVNDVLCSNDAFVTKSSFTTVPKRGSTTGTGSHVESYRIEVCGHGNCKENALPGEDFCLEHMPPIEAEAKMVHLIPKGGKTNDRTPFEKRCHRVVKVNPDFVLRVAKQVFEARDGRLSKNGWKRLQREVDDARYQRTLMEKAEKQNPRLPAS